MSKIADYKISKSDIFQINSHKNNSSKYLEMLLIPVFAFFVIVFSFVVKISNDYFPRSLDGTYLKLFF